ncbi:Lacal_2735 family protein [Neiella marina]|uniref:Lacal_2735 family protein n=1 Tax=Neiella holothuriorum TaxID=2870530 RepID=A0ABS7EJS6_9GAMM|nr:DUF6435 family protein [Neiella holothuriorum]MBW8192470.1 Lacal_2735 family protein [Neiella holothuriorum]
MLNIFKRDPAKKMRKQRTLLLKSAMLAQRKGDMRSFANLSAEAEQLTKEIDKYDE